MTAQALFTGLLLYYRLVCVEYSIAAPVFTAFVFHQVEMVILDPRDLEESKVLEVHQVHRWLDLDWQTLWNQPQIQIQILYIGVFTLYVGDFILMILSFVFVSVGSLWFTRCARFYRTQGGQKSHVPRRQGACWLTWGSRSSWERWDWRGPWIPRTERPARAKGQPCECDPLHLHHYRLYNQCLCFLMARPCGLEKLGALSMMYPDLTVWCLFAVGTSGAQGWSGRCRLSGYTWTDRPDGDSGPPRCGAPRGPWTEGQPGGARPARETWRSRYSKIIIFLRETWHPSNLTYVTECVSVSHSCLIRVSLDLFYRMCKCVTLLSHTHLLLQERKAQRVRR